MASIYIMLCLHFASSLRPSLRKPRLPGSLRSWRPRQTLKTMAARGAAPGGAEGPARDAPLGAAPPSWKAFPARPPARAPLAEGRRRGGPCAFAAVPPPPPRPSRTGRRPDRRARRGAARRGPRGRRPTWRPPPPPPRRGRHVSRTQNGGTWPGFVAAARGGGERSRARRPPCCGPGGRVVARVPHSLRWRRVRARRPGLTEPPGPRDRGPERRPPPPPPPPPGARAQPRSLGRAATPSYRRAFHHPPNG
ncbi:uncharacterized protein LOC144324354 isoform X3 [Canis aureus]